MLVIQGTVSMRLRLGLSIVGLSVLAIFAALYFLSGMAQPLAFDMALILALSGFCLRLVFDKAGQIRVVISAGELFFTAGAAESDRVIGIAGMILVEGNADWFILDGTKIELCLKNRWFDPADRIRLAAELRSAFLAAGCEIRSKTG